MVKLNVDTIHSFHLSEYALMIQQTFQFLRDSGEHQKAAALVEKLLQTTISDIKRESPKQVEFSKIDLQKSLIDQLISIYPEIAPHFLPLEEWYRPSSFSNYYLSPEGVKKAMSALQVKKMLKTEWVVCDSLNDFEIKLELWLKQKKDKVAFIVYNEKEHHFSPVFINRKEGIHKVVVTDSIGRQSASATDFKPESTFAGPIHERLLSTFEKLPDVTYHIYSYMGTYRQYDRVLCPIFSIHDCLKMFKCTQVIEWIEKQPPLQGSNSVFTYIDELPGALMKTTQNGKRIDETIKTMQDTTVDGGKGYSDFAKGKLYTICNKDGTTYTANLKAYLTFLKYQKTIICDVIGSLVPKG